MLMKTAVYYGRLGRPRKTLPISHPCDTFL